MLIAILFTLLIVITLLLYMQFLGYPLFMSRVLSGNKNVINKDYSFQPFISVIVPTFNEASVIRKRIENLLSQSYPKNKFEMIIVDSGSQDDTIKIGKEFQKQYNNIKIIEEGIRRGKASAVNLAKQHSRGEIVLVTDANDVFNSYALKEIAPHFKNPNVGGVGGYFILTNGENGLLNGSSIYWQIESLVRRGETVFDSACTFHGELNAWRKDLTDADINSLAEDLDMAVQIRRKGYRITYEPDAIVYEAGPTNIKEQVIQKKRTALGTIQTFFKFKKYFWLPKDKYSALIFPFHKTLQIFSPFLILGSLALIVFLAASKEFLPLLVYSGITFLLLLLSFLLLTRELIKIKIKNNSDTFRFTCSRLKNIMFYVFLHEFIILLAWKDFIFRHYSVTWQKAETTRI